jgi:hypothetical protein
MDIDKIIFNLESTIVRLSKDIKKNRRKSNVERLNNLSKLVNSYTRLIDRTRGISAFNNGIENYYDDLEKSCIDRKR